MNRVKSLADLVSPWLTITEKELANITVTKLELDSRKIESGDTFVAIQGHQVDGRHYIANAIEKGATVASGGFIDEQSRTFQPTMLTDVTPDMLITQEEIFAPVIPVMTYDSLQSAIDYIEQRDKPLALYVYSDNQSTIETVLLQTSSGGVTVNGVFSHYLENQLPFGGVNHSGMGSYHGYFGFKAFSHERAVYIHQ